VSAAATPVIAPRRLRCAIYTRKSSEEGLEQDFNSLHAQREACEAYVRSQAGEGWTGIATPYDDGGYSGGSLARPGLAKLLADVDAGRIDIVAVYKVDRLTRSLADFAKIVERFDSRQVSFVSVTQAFNTTTSMGRLTLNVLLSFSQFEREVTGERIRDKIAASKAKGMWMGGNVPLGYDAAGRALTVNPAEADQVRHIFERYLALGSVHALRDELNAQGFLSKRRVTKAGKEIGGLPFWRGALFHLLSNRHYLGLITHKELTHQGTHPAIVEEDLFDKVQARLAQNAGKARRAKAGLGPKAPAAPLAGLVFDDRGNPMASVNARKGKGRLYRYYVSAPLQQGRRQDAGSLPRFPGLALEDLLRARLGALGVLGGGEELASRIERIEVGGRQVLIRLDLADDLAAHVRERLDPEENLDVDEGRGVLTIPAVLRWRGGVKLAVGPRGLAAVETPRVDLALLRALIRAESWKAQMLDGTYKTLNDLALAQDFTDQYARVQIRLAFLSPTLKRAIIEGTMARGTSLGDLAQAATPLAWSDQWLQLQR